MSRNLPQYCLVVAIAPIIIIFFSANVSVLGTRHLVEGTQQRLVGRLFF